MPDSDRAIKQTSLIALVALSLLGFDLPGSCATTTIGKAVEVKPTVSRSATDDHATSSVSTKTTPSKGIQHTARFRPRNDHNVNRYASGVRIYAGNRIFQIGNSGTAIGSKGTFGKQLEHFTLVHKDSTPKGSKEKGDKETTASKSSGSQKEEKKNKNQSEGEESESASLAGYGGANGDSGGGGTQASPGGSTGPEIEDVTANQARAFMRIVRSNFKNWDANRNGRLTLNEVRNSKMLPSLAQKEMAALEALSITMGEESEAAQAGKLPFWTLASLQKAVHDCSQSGKSRMIRKFAEKAQLLDDKFGQKSSGDKEVAAGKTDRKSKGPEFTLGQGSVLVAHQQPVTIHTKHGDVLVAPGAAAYVFQVGDNVSVYNLGDKKSGDVKVLLHDKVELVPVGQQLLLTGEKNTDFGEANPDKDINYRNVQSLGKVKDVNVMGAEYSPLSALDNIGQFHDLLNSTDAADRKVAMRMIKAAAISLTLGQPFDDPQAAGDKTSDAAAPKTEKAQ